MMSQEAARQEDHRGAAGGLGDGQSARRPVGRCSAPIPRPASPQEKRLPIMIVFC